MNPEVTTRQIIKEYWNHAWKYKGLVLGVFISAALAVLTFQFLPPLVIAGILDRLSTGDFASGDLWGSFGADLLTYAGLSVLGGIVMWRLAVIFIWKLEMNVVRDIYQRIFKHLINQSASFHANRFGGSLVSQTNKFVGGYIRVADTTVFQMVGLIMSFVFTTVILAPRAPWITVAIIAFSVVFMTMAVFITKRIRELNAIEAAATNKQTGVLADAVTNVLAIKSFARNKYENQRFADATETTKQATHNVMRASIKRDIAFSGMSTTMAISIITAVTATVVLYDANISLVFLVFQYTSNIGQRLWEFSQSVLRNYNRALGDAKDMTAILNIESEVKDPEHPEQPRISSGAIAFNHVDFTHSDSKQGDVLFKDLNIRIKPGEKVGLVGRSGSGKTTLTKLILRFMDINAGEITIDRQNIAAITQEDLRAHIAYVPQEPMLFHRSLRENIAYGALDTSEEAIIGVAKMAHAHEFIEQLPLGYDTLVGERGVKLSGGQRQRIAIARAMLKNAPILLLDEATSALDSESEALIQDALWKLMEGRTAIVIAHRLSTIQKMDRILVMDEGKIVEEGSHKALISQKGIYAELWSHQSGGFMQE